VGGGAVDSLSGVERMAAHGLFTHTHTYILSLSLSLSLSHTHTHTHTYPNTLEQLNNVGGGAVDALSGVERMAAHGFDAGFWRAMQQHLFVK